MQRSESDRRAQQRFRQSQEWSRSDLQSALRDYCSQAEAGDVVSQGGNQWHETVVVRDRETNLRNVTVPVILVIMGAFFLVGVTYAATANFEAIKHGIQNIKTKLDGVTSELATRIERMDRDIQESRQGDWTVRDQELWCAKTEAINSGWRCGRIQRGRQIDRPALTTDGWQITEPGTN